MTSAPMVGTFACCARAASGPETTAPPSSVMNSRQVIDPCDSKGLRSLGAPKARSDVVSVFHPGSGTKRDRYRGLCHCGAHVWAILMQGYVTLVSPEDAHHLQRGKWYAETTTG